VSEIKKLVDKELGYVVEGSLSSHSKVGNDSIINDTPFCCETVATAL